MCVVTKMELIDNKSNLLGDDLNKMSTSTVRYEQVTDYRDLLNKMNSIE